MNICNQRTRHRRQRRKKPRSAQNDRGMPFNRNFPHPLVPNCSHPVFSSNINRFVRDIAPNSTREDCTPKNNNVRTVNSIGHSLINRSQPVRRQWRVRLIHRNSRARSSAMHAGGATGPIEERRRTYLAGLYDMLAIVQTGADCLPQTPGLFRVFLVRLLRWRRAEPSLIHRGRPGLLFDRQRRLDGIARNRKIKNGTVSIECQLCFYLCKV